MTEPKPTTTPPGSLASLRETLLAAAAELEAAPGRANGGAAAGDRRTSIVLERPKRARFGDYSTNAALLLAPSLKAPPREVAERLGRALSERLGASLEGFEVAGPGFLNLFLGDGWLREALASLLAAGEDYGAGGVEKRERVLVEFVSANPTGPMHVGHARNAAYGDSLARILAWHGHRVEREFYVNDAGSQIAKLGESIAALARGEEVPQDGYKGEYVAELAARIEGADAMEPAALGREAVARMLDAIKGVLDRFRVLPFDHWQFESALHEGEPSLVAHALDVLREQGETYESEGALWLRTTDFGDDKDRVLIRSGGEHTYFASDIAYHQAKRERGFERQIDVWGADHHGYVKRIKAAYQALGGDPEELDLLIMQLVHLVSSGERAQMSKRSGEFVTLEELIEEVGVDAARWYLLARSHDTTVDLDLDLAREQSNENPVYYVQYAHARIASVLEKAGAGRVEEALAGVGAGGAAGGRGGRADGAGGEGDAGGTGGERDTGGEVALHPSERALVIELLAFPGEVADSAARRAPHRVAAYALALAQSFTAFYRDCHVVGAEPEGVESWRLALCVASQRTIARCLELLGIEAPEHM